jgi:hypothetical protein
MVKTKKFSRIKPNYIKDTKGKTIQVLLDMKSYESMIARIKEFESIAKAEKRMKKSKI